MAFALPAALALSLAACGGGGREETSGAPEAKPVLVESRGLFLLEQEEGAEFPDLPRFDREAVKRVYPDLPVDKFEDAFQTWVAEGQAALASMKQYGPKILEFYTARLKNE